MGLPGVSGVENLPASAGAVGSISGSGRAPGGRNGNLLSILAWRVPSTGQPGRLQSLG